MNINKLTPQKKFYNTSVRRMCTLFCFSTLSLLSSCMTSSRQDQLQGAIDKLQEEVIKLQAQVNSKEQQINNTTQSVLASQSDAQSLRDQMLLTQGAIDEIKNHLKKIEENAGASSSANTPHVVNISNNSDFIAALQKQVSRLDLMANTRFVTVRKGKLPAKIKNIADLTKYLKTNFDAGHFKQVIDFSTSVLLASESTEQMIATALEYRGEARFQIQDYKNAAIDLSLIADGSINIPRKGRAFLIAGDSYVYLKNNSIASLYYQDCVKNYATTSEGKAAAARLASLSSQMTPPSSPSDPSH